MWTLILVVALDGTGSAIHSRAIDGFQSRKSCEQAIETFRAAPRRLYVVGFCVDKGQS